MTPTFETELQDLIRKHLNAGTSSEDDIIADLQLTAHAMIEAQDEM